jgi:hypothetical protein
MGTGVKLYKFVHELLIETGTLRGATGFGLYLGGFRFNAPSVRFLVTLLDARTGFTFS